MNLLVSGHIKYRQHGYMYKIIKHLSLLDIIIHTSNGMAAVGPVHRGMVILPGGLQRF